jgi:hypothetical protein
MDEFRCHLKIHATSHVGSQVSGYASKRLLSDGNITWTGAHANATAQMAP